MLTSLRRSAALFGMVALGSAAALLGTSCESRFTGCEKGHSCPEEDAGGMSGTGGNGDGGGATGGDGGAGGSDVCDPPCGGSTPVCDEDAEECVECLDEGDCDEGLCDLATHTCVECLDHSDCTTPGAARCDAGECVQCTDSSQCTGISGATVCDASGECVECTVDDESPCNGNSCNPATNTCTENPLDDSVTCKPCLADSECRGDRRCIELSYQGEPHGWYCMPLPPMGGCIAAPAPWKVPLTNRESRSGVEATDYCGINEGLTTCEAVHAALEGEGAGTCVVDEPSACPTGGVCKHVGSMGSGFPRCTYLCNSPNQCPDEPEMDSCPGGGDDRYCGLEL